MFLQILRFAWPWFVTLGMWICGFLLIVIWGKAEKRRLLKIVLWAFPVFLVPAVWIVAIIVSLSNGHGPPL